MSMRFAYVYYVFSSLVVVLVGVFIVALLVALILLIPAALSHRLPEYWSTVTGNKYLSIYYFGNLLFGGFIVAHRLYFWLRLNKPEFEQEVHSIPFARWIVPASADKVVRKHLRPALDK